MYKRQVLIRAIDPLTGIDTMIKNRNGKTGPLLTNGPGKMMQALGITSRKWDLARLEDCLLYTSNKNN